MATSFFAINSSLIPLESVMATSKASDPLEPLLLAARYRGGHEIAKLFSFVSLSFVSYNLINYLKNIAYILFFSLGTPFEIDRYRSSPFEPQSQPH